PSAGTQAVYLAGTFNDWKPTARKLDGPDDSGRFQTKLILDAGTYEYKYVLDGTRWRHDPGNRRQAAYFHNSVIEVGKIPGGGDHRLQQRPSSEAPVPWRVVALPPEGSIVPGGVEADVSPLEAETSLDGSAPAYNRAVSTRVGSKLAFSAGED